MEILSGSYQDSTGILKVDSDAPAAYVRRGPHPSPARTRMPYVSANGVGQAALQDAPAAAPATLAARGGKGGSVTNTHPTRRTTLYLQDAPAAAPATLAEAKAAV